MKVTKQAIPLKDGEALYVKVMDFNNRQEWEATFKAIKDLVDHMENEETIRRIQAKNPPQFE
jgi:hypothetical protein